ncbi:MAG TPA: cytochrome c oxidase subunit II [Chitinophagaceae bacterium]|nr:cytochrome c oxidase subunit II [Chitinophagaceae bacterium]
MQTTFIILILLLGFLITFQIAKASEYVSVMRGEEKSRKQNNKINAFLLLAFLVFGLIGVYYCNEKYGGRILQFGSAASNHGHDVDNMLKITLVITGIVFVITQAILFWFAFKYQESDNRKAYFYPHNNKLEVLWTAIPAIVLTVMVGFGLFYWFRITGEAPDGAMQVEVTGSQFKWEFRYPGKDKVLGKKFYKAIDEGANNPLGQLWEDSTNKDDIYIPPGDLMHLVVNKPVRLIINAKDVIHDVGLSHFRLKMDAVPGTPTTMWFTPTKTTNDMKRETGDPDFVFEISCDQLCGQGHYKMRGTIVVESQEEFDLWMAKQTPKFYLAFPERAPGYKPKTDSVSTNATVMLQPKK